MTRRTAVFQGVALAVVLATAPLGPARAQTNGSPEGVVMPSLVIRAEPPWPATESGTRDVVVLLEVIVGVDGDVASAEVADGVGEPFDAIALETVKKWRFEPARAAGRPVAARIRVPLRFVPTEAPRNEETAPPVNVDATPALATAELEPEPRSEDDGSIPAATTGEPAPPPTPVEVLVVGRAPARTAGAVRRDRAVLEAAPHHTASDLMLAVPGTFVTQHSGEGKAHQIFFRGFDAVHGQDLEIWVGGAPVNQVSNVHGQGYADLHFVMPEVVERIESLPGPYSPDQGDFAVAGSMRFLLGYPEPGFTLRTSLGSFGARRVFLAYHPEAQPAASFAAFEANQTNGFGVGRASRRASGIVQWVRPVGDDAALTVSAASFAGRFGSAGVVRFDDLESGRVERFDSYDTNQGGYSSRTQLVASLEGNDAAYRYALAPYLVFTDLTLRHNYTGFLDDPVNGDSTQQQNDAMTAGFRAHLERTLTLLSSYDSVEIGVASRHDAIDQAQRNVRGTTPNVSSTTIDARVHATTVSGYLDAKLHPIPRLLLRGGARWDAVGFVVQDRTREGGQRSSQGARLGPRVTADVAVAPGLHAIASYGQGYRSPQARSLGDGERAPFTRVWATEGGVRYRDRALEVAGSAFYAQLSDDVVFLETVSRNEPVPSTERRGAVVDFVAQPTPWFTSAIGLTYTRAAFREASSTYDRGALVPFVPEVVLRSDLAARPRLVELLGRDLVGTAGFGATWVHRRPIPFGEFGDDVALLDARVTLRLHEIEVGIESFNLLDREWNDGEFVYASNFEPNAAPSLIPVRHFTAGAPRTVFGTVTLYL